TLLKENKDILNFDCPKGQSSIIKVIGVGGGGNNAVNHMFKLGIIGVDFVNCNTDLQVLEASPVPNIIRFGTKGTGAGNNPEQGRKLAEESADDIRSLLEKNTEMVFITAGMGGGTGTGAAPVVAGIARDLGILTVAVVTEPFTVEGQRRQKQARQGIEELRKIVDVLLVIKNDKLREQYGDLIVTEAYKKADNVLANAVKGIAEIITVRGYVNVDLEDVKTVMRHSGTAIMGIGIAEGEDRAAQAVEEALSSPLLDNIDIRGSKNLLLYITYGDNEVRMDEMGEITELVHERTGNNADLILGHGYDESLGENIAVTIIATGFNIPDQVAPPTPPDIPERKQPGQTESTGQTGQIGGKIIHPLNEEVTENNSSIPSYENLVPEPEPVAVENEATDNTEDSTSDSDSGMQIVVKEDDKPEIKLPEKEEVEAIPSFQKPVTVHQLIPEPNIPVTSAANPSQTAIKTIIAEEDDFELHLSEMPNYSANYQSNTSPVAVRPAQGISVYPKTESDPSDNLTKLRNDKLRNFSMHSRSFEVSESIIEEPAFRRRNVHFEPANHSSESHASNYHLFPGEDGKLIFQQNHFLHDNVD
ncbi:MAG: cell division protein FtsZ, partial [Bacteroidales bacterium]|nr:cell division protein FtsZ [Bacteroidales bacterium]